MVEKKIVQQKGVRPSFNKEEFTKDLISSGWLTEEKAKRISLWKELEESHVKDDDAFACGVRSDQMYQDYDGKIGKIESELSNILSLKSRIGRNTSQIESKEVIDKYPGTDIIMSIRDLEINNLLNEERISDSIAQLWLLLADVYRYVDQYRIDRKIFFTADDYKRLVKKVKDELSKSGIDMYRERV